MEGWKREEMQKSRNRWAGERGLKECSFADTRGEEEEIDDGFSPAPIQKQNAEGECVMHCVCVYLYRQGMDAFINGWSRLHSKVKL